MKFLVAFAAIVTVAMAGTVPVGPAGPAPVVGTPGITTGPAILDFTPISVGPAIVTYPSVDEPVAAPAAESAASPLVQIIVNVQKAEDIATGPVPSPTPIVMPSPSPVVMPSPLPVVMPSPSPIVVPSPLPIVVPGHAINPIETLN